MPGVTGGSTKVFVGNLTSQVSSDIIRKLFEDYGEVSECDVLKNYGFVHMDSEENAERAIEGLNGHEVMGQKILVEASTGSGGKRESTGGGSMTGIRRGGTKIFIGNLPIQATPEFLRKQFSEFGTVMECDILKNYGFVHLDTPENAQKAIEALHGADIFGQKMTVEASTSDVRRNPGMGGANRCFRCGSGGHWSKDCPDGPPGNRRRFAGGPGPMRPSARSMDYHRGGPYGHPRDRYDAYDRYDPYSRYDERYPPRHRLPPLPPRRSPDPRDYYAHPPRRDFSPDRRFADRRPPPPPADPYYLPPRRDDPYASVPREHYPPRDHYLPPPPPPPSSDYRRDYPPAPPKEYPRRYPPVPPREYSPPGSSRYLHAAPAREIPRAYGGFGGRMSPPRRL